MLFASIYYKIWKNCYDWVFFVIHSKTYSNVNIDLISVHAIVAVFDTLCGRWCHIIIVRFLASGHCINFMFLFNNVGLSTVLCGFSSGCVIVFFWETIIFISLSIKSIFPLECGLNSFTFLNVRNFSRPLSALSFFYHSW